MSPANSQPSLRSHEAQHEFTPAAAPAATPPVSQDPPAPDQQPQPVPQGDPPTPEIPQGDPPLPVAAAEQDRGLTLSRQEARAASPVDLAVAGEEDVGVGLEWLQRQPDSGSHSP